MLGDAFTTDVPSRPLVVIPLGATEQHGPHLPLDTDSRIAAAWADELSARLNDRGVRPVLVAPVVNFGASGEHAGFDGTMSVGNDVLSAIVVELGRSIREWSGPVVFLSGHAGNRSALASAIPILRSEGDRVIAILPMIEGSDAHAGRTETSIMLHLAADRVNMDVATAGRAEPISDLIDELRERGIKAVSPNGVLGDPAGASAAEGARLLGKLAEYAIAQIPASWSDR